MTSKISIPDFPSRRDLHSSKSPSSASETSDGSTLGTNGEPSRTLIPQLPEKPEPLVDDSLSSLLYSDDFPDPSEVPSDATVGEVSSMEHDPTESTQSVEDPKTSKEETNSSSILSVGFWTTPRIISVSALALVLLIEGIATYLGLIGWPAWALEIQSYSGYTILAPLCLSLFATSATVEGTDIKLWSYSPTDLVATSGEKFPVTSYPLDIPLYDLAWCAVFINSIVAVFILLLAALPVLHFFTENTHTVGDALGFLPSEDDDDTAVTEGTQVVGDTQPSGVLKD